MKICVLHKGDWGHFSPKWKYLSRQWIRAAQSAHRQLLKTIFKETYFHYLFVHYFFKMSKVNCYSYGSFIEKGSFLFLLSSTSLIPSVLFSFNFQLEISGSTTSRSVDFEHMQSWKEN